jgi:hypothetical protein
VIFPSQSTAESISKACSWSSLLICTTFMALCNPHVHKRHHLSLIHPANHLQKRRHCKYRFKLNHYLCWIRTCITLFSLLSVTIKCLSVHYSQSLSKKQPLLVQIFQHSTFTSTNTENNWKVVITMLWIFQIWENNSNPISKHEKRKLNPREKRNHILTYVLELIVL